jgi:hypothetical protein
VTRYQTLLLVVLIVWPLAILALLFFMSRLEAYVQRLDARTPQEAGLEPITGEASEREVRIMVGENVVGERPDTAPRDDRPGDRDVAAS